MKKKVFLTRKLHDFAIKDLKKHYQVEVHTGKIPISRRKLESKMEIIDGLICFPYDQIDNIMLNKAKRLKVISTFSVGFDHIDIESAKKNKIRVGYTPEILTDATADLAFSLMIDIMRRVSEGDRIIRGGNWKKIFGAYDYVGMDLQKKTLGIFGLGRIGSTFAKRAKSFDMKIIYNNRKPLPKSKEKKIGVKFVSFEQLLKQSDVISIHVPHTPQTHQLFNKKIFEKMKKSAFLINTARGKIINENDLVDSLKKKKIAGAALDVFEFEPIGKSHSFTKISNITLTPHIGSSTEETRAKMAEITVKNLHLGIRGKKPKFSVGF